jgi:HEAT repeats
VLGVASLLGLSLGTVGLGVGSTFGGSPRGKLAVEATRTQCVRSPLLSRRRAYGRKREDMAELPNRPHLRHLRREARLLQRASGEGFQSAQERLAQSYGFENWAGLKYTIEAGSVVLEWAGRLLGKRELEGLRDRGEAPLGTSILAALRHPNPRVRYECLGLLDHLADDDCVPAMIAATSDPVPRVRRMAVHALGCQGCKSSDLCADLNSVFLPIAEHDRVWRVRQEAVLSVAQQPATKLSRAVLARVAVSDPHPEVRKQAGWALRIQEGRPWSYGQRRRNEDGLDATR